MGEAGEDAHGSRGEKIPLGLAGCTLTTRCMLGGVGCKWGHTEQPGCSGTGSGVQQWQGGTQPCSSQVKAEEGSRRQGVLSPHGTLVLTLSPMLDYS